MYLRYRLVIFSKGADDMYVEFDPDCERRQQNLINNKTLQRKHHVKIMLRDFSGFAERRDSTTYCLGHTLPLKMNTDNAVINKDAATEKTKIVITIIVWFVPHCRSIGEGQFNLSEQLLSIAATELYYIHRPVFMKEVITQKN